MIVAIVKNDTIEQTGELSVLFPNVSFPSGSPTAEWMAENNLVPVTYFKAYDAATQKLVSVDPYLEGGEVFAVAVEPLTPEEIAARNASIEAANKVTRNAKLRDTDWTQLADVTLTAECKGEFMAYRHTLRTMDMLNPEWPVEPKEVWDA